MFRNAQMPTADCGAGARLPQHTQLNASTANGPQGFKVALCGAAGIVKGRIANGLGGDESSEESFCNGIIQRASADTTLNVDQSK